MFEAIADTLRHPLVERERRRWSRRLSRWPNVAAGLGVAAIACLAASLANRFAAGAAPPLSPAAYDAAFRASMAGSLAMAALAPVALAAWQMAPWLRGAEFEELLGTTASRGGIARALCFLAWTRSASWTLAAQAVGALIAFALFHAETAWRLAAAQGALALALLPTLWVSCSMATRVALERRAFGGVLWRALAWQLLAFPLLAALAAAIFVMGFLVMLAPLLALATYALSAVLGSALWPAILAGLLIGLAALFAWVAGAMVAGMNLSRAEVWCVPTDWLESTYRWGGGEVAPLAAPPAAWTRRGGRRLEQRDGAGDHARRVG